MESFSTFRDRAQLAAEARGLLFLGVAPLAVDDAYPRFHQWLSEGRHGEMRWLEQHSDVRSAPERLLPGATAALVFALPYADANDDAPTPRVAKYARFRDYHRVLADDGAAIAATLREQFGGTFRVAVDTLPLLEKAIAGGTAEGFFGKHSCYVHPTHGSFLLLMELLTTLPIATDMRPQWDGVRRNEHGGCGSCTLCQVRCPTGALDDAYRIDARKCLSYWTIEHRGTIPTEFWPFLAEYWYGCDICQDVCPYNRKSKAATSTQPSRALPPLDAVAVMTQRQYEEWFGGSAMTRAKRNGLRRNALLALAVLDAPEFPSSLEQCRQEPALADTVRQIEAAITNGTLVECRTLRLQRSARKIAPSLVRGSSMSLKRLPLLLFVLGRVDGVVIANERDCLSAFTGGIPALSETYETGFVRAIDEVRVNTLKARSEIFRLTDGKDSGESTSVPGESEEVISLKHEAGQMAKVVGLTLSPYGDHFKRYQLADREEVAGIVRSVGDPSIAALSVPRAVTVGRLASAAKLGEVFARTSRVRVALRWDPYFKQVETTDPVAFASMVGALEKRLSAEAIHSDIAALLAAAEREVVH